MANDAAAYDDWVCGDSTVSTPANMGTISTTARKLRLASWFMRHVSYVSALIRKQAIGFLALKSIRV